VHKVFVLSNKHLNNLWGKASTHNSLSNPFFFCYFFSHTSCLLSVCEQKICTCVIQICLIPCFVLLASFFLIFVLLLGLGQEVQQVVCRAIGCFSSSSLYPLSFGCSNILYTCGMTCLIPYFICKLLFFSYIVYMFLGLGQEAWPPCLLGAFPLICWLFFFLF